MLKPAPAQEYNAAIMLSQFNVGLHSRPSDSLALISSDAVEQRVSTAFQKKSAAQRSAVLSQAGWSWF
jgi:hypothetical protein